MSGRRMSAYRSFHEGEMTVTFDGITCKSCGRDERTLDKFGIAMNIPLETCNACLKKRPGAFGSLGAHVNVPQDNKYKEFVREIRAKYESVLVELCEGNDPRDSGMDLKEMAEAFLEILVKADDLWKEEHP